MKIQDDRMYTESHEWVKFEDDTTATVGLSDYAQDQLGDLVFVNLPEEGGDITAGESFADVESVKAVSDVYSPVSGTVIAINGDLLDDPGKINEDAYDAWICRVGGITDKAKLMSAAEYRAFMESIT